MLQNGWHGLQEFKENGRVWRLGGAMLTEEDCEHMSLSATKGLASLYRQGISHNDLHARNEGRSAMIRKENGARGGWLTELATVEEPPEMNNVFSPLVDSKIRRETRLSGVLVTPSLYGEKLLRRGDRANHWQSCQHEDVHYTEQNENITGAKVSGHTPARASSPDLALPPSTDAHHAAFSRSSKS